MSVLRAVNGENHNTAVAVTDADIDRVRRDFPILEQTVHGRPLAYLDNAASSQKPQAVIDAISGCYGGYYANIHRGVHRLSQLSTEAYEAVREKARALLGAKSEREIIFTRGATESINLVAFSYGRANIGPGDEVIISTIEHHSNIVPWQMLCEQQGAVLRVIPVSDRGELDLDAYRELLSERTRMVAVVHVSNALGTVNPVREIIDLAHQHGAPVLIDGAQAAPHLALDVQALDCDFYAVSSHKMFGPSGVGVLYGKTEYLSAMPPYQGGGDMILSVSLDKTEYAELPHKFEAGTPNIGGVIGFGAAIDWLLSLGYDWIGAHERDLLEYATARCRQVPGLTVIGEAEDKAGVLSFVLDGIHPHDIGTILDRQGVAVRTGHHCAQPVMQRFGVPATVRASFAAYNTRAEVDALIDGIYQAKEMFGR